MINFSIFPKKNPYLNAPGGTYEIWSDISVINENEILFHCEWDMLELLEWFLINENELKNGIFPKDDNSGRSIAEKFDLYCTELRNIDEENDSEYYDKILAPYWESHYFILRGSKFPRFYLGLNDFNQHVSKGELSFLDKLEKKYVRYDFEMIEFIDDTFKICKKCISEWQKFHFTIEAYNRIEKMQMQYGKILLE